jgi:hypothetical protein
LDHPVNHHSRSVWEGQGNLEHTTYSRRTFFLLTVFEEILIISYYIMQSTCNYSFNLSHFRMAWSHGTPTLFMKNMLFQQYFKNYWSLGIRSLKGSHKIILFRSRLIRTYISLKLIVYYTNKIIGWWISGKGHSRSVCIGQGHSMYT